MRLCLFCVLLAATLPLYSPALPAETAVHIRDSGQNYSGQLLLNQAAGHSHQQVNARAIALGSGAQAVLEIEQQREPMAPPATGMDASAHIAGAAFSQGQGVLGINQSAGLGNQSRNSLGISWGALPEPLDDSLLARTVAPLINSEAVVPQRGERRVETDDQAFAASRGVVQLNQSAGMGNRSLNRLSIRVLERP